MNWTKNPNRSGTLQLLRRRLRCWPGFAAYLFRGALLVALGAVLMAAQQAGQQANGSTQPPAPGRPAAAPATPPGPQGGSPNVDAEEAQRKKQIADDSARLLALATDLKVEVDKTTKDTLSLAVIRKADEIEKLAHQVKDKTKLTAGIN